MKITIIGAGPSGLMAGIISARNGHQVIILERNDRAGKKLLATGNGRCNYTNENISIERYHGNNPKFAYSALSKFTYEDAVTFFSEIGMDTTLLTKGRAYPRSLQASSVLKVLLMELEYLSGKILYNEKVTSIEKNDSFIIKTEDNEYESDLVIVATGGMTLKNTGSDGSGYDLAKALGHSLTSLGPGIIQMNLKGKGHEKMSGTRFEGILSLYEEGKFVHSDEDEILFTDYGISGPAVLQLSRRAIDILKDGKRAFFSIDLFSEFSEEDLLSKLSYDFAISNRTLGEVFIGKINDNLIEEVLEGLDLNQKVSSLNFNAIEKLVKRLKGWSFEISGYRSVDGGQVTVGGINTEELKSSTMESKIVDGLYFVGEIIDIDGDCGGFNLHWAWASANAAASSI